jgi:hypothetical protein
VYYLVETGGKTSVLPQTLVMGSDGPFRLGLPFPVPRGDLQGSNAEAVLGVPRGNQIAAPVGPPEA